MLKVDKEGYLLNLHDWSPQIATQLAQHEGFALTAEHWQIIELLRRFYQNYQLSPTNRVLVKYAAEQLGTEIGNSAHLNRLFNGAPAKLAAKLAGLPKPANCL